MSAAAAPFRTEMLTLDGQTVRVGVRTGRPGGLPLLVFNGIGGNIELLAPFAQAFAEATLVTFDIPGVGHSAMPARPYRLADMARLAQQILATLGLERVDVLGVSWGGALAQEFARRFPAQCQRLVLAATTTGFVMLPGRLEAVWKMATPRRYVDRDFARQIVGAIYGGVFRTRPETAEHHFAHVRWQSHLGYYLQLLALAGWTSVHWLHRLPQPTLVMVGEDDPIVRPANGWLQHRLLRHGTLQRFSCGHLFLITQPEASADAIRQFLASHPVPC